LLAMDVNENACLLAKRGVLETIASKLAPTGLVGVRSICGLPNLLWELARESGSSASDDVGCADAFASELAPTGLVGVRSICELPNLLWEQACPRKR